MAAKAQHNSTAFHSPSPKFQAWVPYFLLMPALIVMVGILIPFFTSVYYTLTDFRLGSPKISFVGLQNYIDLVTSGEFLHQTSVTLRYAFFAVGIESVLGLIIALLLNTETIAAKIGRVFLLFPLMIAPIVGTLLWKLMMSPTFGVLNYFLSFFGMRDFAWGAAPQSAMLTVVLVDVWIFTPFFALLILAGLRAMPQAPFEAARVDGASGFFIFKNLTLPMILPYYLVAMVFRLIDSLRQFDIIYGMTKGGPFDVLMNYQVTAYTRSFSYKDFSGGATIMVINFLIILVVSKLLITYWRKAQDKIS
jgi:multiple sugar transport system permease protein